VPPDFSKLDEPSSPLIWGMTSPAFNFMSFSRFSFMAFSWFSDGDRLSLSSPNFGVR
jgi:hypothetical protein